MADSNSVDLKPKIIFEDQHLVVLSKPPGLLSQGDISGDVDLVALMRIHFGRHYVGLVHRLDRNTSGLMVVAKRSKSAERLSEQLINGALRRNYHAIVLGNFPEKRRLKHFLIKNESTNEVRAFDRPKEGAKEAALWIHPLVHFTQGDIPLTLVELELETGRSHQIRVQCAVSGFPLAGDQKYGTPAAKRLFHRPALHSSSLSFFHPMTKEECVYTEEMASDVQGVFPQAFAESENRR